MTALFDPIKIGRRICQSEAVFLQFADLLVYEDGNMVDRWPTFPVSA
jgi:D-serine deaminase-like pyridoxal phosphate-dependent protein